MAESISLDFAALTAPIDPAHPAGTKVPYDKQLWLENARKAVTDPGRPAEDLKKADWAGIVRTGQELLTSTSKDLLVAARMTEALVKLHGFAGLKQGLRLLRELVENCWDRLHPPLEDGDLEARAGPFHWLDSPDTGARFPSTIRLLPLFSFEGVSYSWVDQAPPEPGKVSPKLEAFKKAAEATRPDDCARLAQDMDASLEELRRLRAALTARMGAAAPELLHLQEAIAGCRSLIKLPADSRPVTAPAPDIQPEGPAPPPPPPRAPATRADAYRQLAEAADLLEKLEPHSPIPFLVRRAVKLGSKSFPELIKELIQNKDVINVLTRELDLPDKEAPAAPPKK